MSTKINPLGNPNMSPHEHIKYGHLIPTLIVIVVLLILATYVTWNIPVKERIIRLIIGVIIGDFLAALVHFIEDNYMRYRPEQPNWMNKIALDNELHHHFPRLLTASSHWDVVFESIIVALVGALILIMFVPKFTKKYADVIATALLVASQGNGIHRFQHMRDCERPWIISKLMECYILQPREMHRSHHLGIPDGRYAVILSFTNPIYDSLCIWDVLRTGLKLLNLHPCYVSSNLWVKDEAICPESLSFENDETKILFKKMMSRLKELREENVCAYYSRNEDFKNFRCDGNPQEFCFDRDISRLTLY